jgi:RNA polymerase sigma-70 factor (ECF subfamily)
MGWLLPEKGVSMDDESTFRALLHDLRAGRDEAAKQIVDRYTSALVAVARRQSGAKLARRVDPDDIVQSVYRSLFVRIPQGQYELGSGEDLWKLLVTMTLNKVRRAAKFHHAARRDISLEQSRGSGSAACPEGLTAADEPDPAEAAQLVDEVQAFLSKLPLRDRPIVELRLQGYSSAEISHETGRAERSVRRVLERVQRRLESAEREVESSG